MQKWNKYALCSIALRKDKNDIKYESKSKEENLTFKFKYLSYKNLLENLKIFSKSIFFKYEHYRYLEDYIKMLDDLIKLKDYL